jgi:hypothetical protein
MRWPEPAHTEQSLARERPTKGGAVRIRIALLMALAVTIFTTTLLTLLGSSPAASARISVHHTYRAHRAPGSSTTRLAFFQLPVAVQTPTGSTLELSGYSSPTVVLQPIAPPPPPVVPRNDSNSVYTADWMCIRRHESGNIYNDPAEPSGAYGILISTWREFGFSGWPYQAQPIVQDALALRLYSLYGFHPWSSRFACGL